MDPQESQEKIARLQDLLRQAFALANEIGYLPNIRSVGPFAAKVEPTPLPVVAQVIPPETEERE